jgi:methylated-DNA-[protein]-cysteine S-methyltransferase
MSTRLVDETEKGGRGPRRPRPPRPDAAPDVVGRYRTHWGMGTVTVRKGRLVGVELPDATEPVPVVEGLAPLPSSEEPAPIDQDALDHWVAELEAYFRGERLAWRPEEVALDDLGLGTFERVVYTTLLSIPPAVTVSYGVLAEMAGHPRAARAVGNAMAANPIPVVVPCHRVIRADGSLGNYGTDPAWKKRLLVHEHTHSPWAR